jgi:hypothetical protein
MDSKQRYLGDSEQKDYEFDYWFMEQLNSMSEFISSNIMTQIYDNYLELNIQNSWSQIVGGVVKGKYPYFFEIEFFNEEDGVPIFLEIQEIDLDTYLDYITKKQTFKTYE